MRYRTLGRSGLSVSCVSLGSWLTFGNAVDAAATERIVRRAHELGVVLFDTADVYNRGEGERALGKAIHGLRREHLVLASKCFFPMSEDVNDRGLSRKHILESLHASLRRLATDYLDLYQCHRPDPAVPLAETARAMHDLIQAGKVLYWGVSMWPPELLRSVTQLCAERGWHAPISNQPPYNLLERSIEQGVIAAGRECGIGQIVYSPLAQGVLTGKYRNPEVRDPKTRAGNPKINQFLGKWLTDDALQRVEGLRQLAQRLGLSAAQVALAFCLRHDEVASVIVGATSEQQLEDNVRAAAVTLPPDAVAELDRLFPVTAPA